MSDSGTEPSTSNGPASNGPASNGPVPAVRDSGADSDQWWGSAPAGMPSWVTGAIWRLAGGIVILAAGWWLAQTLRSLLIVIFISVFLSFAIEPAVNSLERRGVRRGVGTGIMFLAILGSITGFGILMGQVIAEQITELVNEAPERVLALESWLQDNIDDEIDLGELQRTVSDSGEFRSRATDVAGGLVDFGGALIRALFDIFTIVLFTFYLVAEGPKFRRTICSMLPPSRQRDVLRIWDIGTVKTGGYIVSRLILVVVAFLAHWLAFELLGVRFSLVIALWVGLVSQFVPVIGTYVAAIFPVLIALADKPIVALWVVLFMIVWQQIENYLIAPRVTSQTMAVHPAVAFGAVIAGTAILGAVGALLALPVTATIQGFVSSYMTRYKVDEVVGVEHLTPLETEANGGNAGPR